jgi:hypothetical protein
VFRSTTRSGFFVPRAFRDDTPEDKRAIQDVINLIDAYPLAEFDGEVTKRDWSKLPHFPPPDSGGAETKWVFPETFFDQLPLLLDDATPLPGEEPRYAALRQLVAAARKDPKLKAAIIDEAKRADAELVAPLFEFRNVGIPLPHHWTTVDNGAAFGTDYFTRTAVGKSNILVNKPQETKYNQHHFFEPNAIKRYSVGTTNKDLRKAADGSLTIHVQADEPEDAVAHANWLPSPKNADFSLYVRACWPEEAIQRGQWTPPSVVKVR